MASISNPLNNRSLITAGLLLGIGMGGFLDGIVFHQILQIHSMLSAKLPQDNLVNVKVSMVWDGLFHLLTWFTTAIGLVMLWKAGRMPHAPWSAKTIWGALLIGWGIFNTVEGFIDHHIFNVHHVVERLGLSIYDYTFLASGILLVIIGTMLIRAGAKDIRKAVAAMYKV